MVFAMAQTKVAWLSHGVVPRFIIGRVGSVEGTFLEEARFCVRRKLRLLWRRVCVCVCVYIGQTSTSGVNFVAAVALILVCFGLGFGVFCLVVFVLCFDLF